MDNQMNEQGTVKMGGLALPKSHVHIFSNLQNAMTFCEQGTKPLRIMLGDDERFWVVTPAVAAKLEASGYEYA